MTESGHSLYKQETREIRIRWCPTTKCLYNLSLYLNPHRNSPNFSILSSSCPLCYQNNPLDTHTHTLYFIPTAQAGLETIPRSFFLSLCVCVIGNGYTELFTVKVLFVEHRKEQYFLGKLSYMQCFLSFMASWRNSEHWQGGSFSLWYRKKHCKWCLHPASLKILGSKEDTSNSFQPSWEIGLIICCLNFEYF